MEQQEFVDALEMHAQDPDDNVLSVIPRARVLDRGGNTPPCR